MSFEGSLDEFNDLLDYFKQVRNALEEFDIPIAVIIDEYNIPIVQYLEDDILRNEQKEELENNSKLLHLLFNHIENDIRGSISHFIVTGVAIFTKALFSVGNHIQDYSFKRDVATLYGYTQLDVETYFSDHLIELSKVKGISTDQLLSEIIKYFDGYCFSFDRQFTQTVLNPYDINKLFSEQSIEYVSYWMTEGLSRYLGRKQWMENIDLSHWQNTHVADEEILKFEPQMVISSSPAALLTQVGILTIRHVNERIVLDFPNEQVRAAFFFSLFKENINIIVEYSRKCFRLIVENKPYEFLSQLDRFVICILCSRSFKSAKHEAYFHTCLSLLMSLMGLKVVSRRTTNTGIINLVVEQNSFVWVIELKFDKPVGDALQLERKELLKKFESLGKEIFCFEIDISMKINTLSPNDVLNSTISKDEEGIRSLQKANGYFEINNRRLKKGNPITWSQQDVEAILTDVTIGVGLSTTVVPVNFSSLILQGIVEHILRQEEMTPNMRVKDTLCNYEGLENMNKVVAGLIVRWVWNHLIEKS